MTPDLLFVFALLAATILLFVSERVRLDLVAMLALLALMLSGLLTTAEALAGFSDPVVLIIAGLFVVGAGLAQTGVADSLGRWLGRVAGTGETGLIAVIMVTAAVLSAFMSSTGTTAVLLPVVVSLAREARISPSRLLMPLAFASLLGGLLTLIGTPPNIVVSEQLAAAGLAPFSFFAFTPVGVVMLALGVIFMILVGRRLLPERIKAPAPTAAAQEILSIADLVRAYQVAGNLFRLRIRRSSPLLGQSLLEANLTGRYGITVLEIQPRPGKYALPLPAKPAGPETVLNAFDILHAKGSPEAIRRLAREQDFAIMADEAFSDQLISQELGMVEVLLPPRSRLIGRTLHELRFRERYGVTVLAIQHLGRPVTGDLARVPLSFGDTLLVEGTWEKINLLREESRNFIVVDQPREMIEAQRATRRAPVAIAIVTVMLGLMAFEVVPTVTAVLLAAAAMILTGCLAMEDAYRSMNWESVVLIAGMLPMATALQKTGGVDFIAQSLTAAFGAMGPLALMAGLFVLTAVLSLFISNTATAVLVAPIALQAATTLGLAPHAFLMAVAVAASTSFATPVASPVNTLVLGPGGYRFSDYSKIGLTMQLLMLVAALVLLPLLFPL
jgi:di/tricarboxylate transporter